MKYICVFEIENNDAIANVVSLSNELQTDNKEIYLSDGRFKLLAVTQYDSPLAKIIKAYLDTVLDV